MVNGLEGWEDGVRLVIVDAADKGFVQAAIEQILVLHASIAEGGEGLILVGGGDGAGSSKGELQVVSTIEWQLQYCCTGNDLAFGVGRVIDQRRLSLDG